MFFTPLDNPHPTRDVIEFFKSRDDGSGAFLAQATKAVLKGFSLWERGDPWSA